MSGLELLNKEEGLTAKDRARRTRGDRTPRSAFQGGVMNKKTLAVIITLAAWCVINVPPSPAILASPGRDGETLSALAVLPAGPGAGRSAGVNITNNSYFSSEEGQSLHAMLIDRRPHALLRALEEMKARGRVAMTGTVGFYEFKVIISVPSGSGRRILAAADRPISFLEQYYGTRSADYRFGFMELNLDQRDRGEGSLTYAAKLKVINSDKIEIENLGIEPIKLMRVRKL